MLLGVMAANGQLHAPGRRGPERTLTTFAGVVVCGPHLCVLHVGDSRVYRYRPGTGMLSQLTEDDTVENRAAWTGAPIDVTAAAPDACTLTQALGRSRHLTVRPGVHRWAPGDILLLCTDGVSDALDRDDIVRVLDVGCDLESLSLRLAQRALAAGSDDNATAVLVRSVS